MALSLSYVPALTNGSNCTVPTNSTGGDDLFCLNGGNCVVEANVTVCDCLTGFSGAACADGAALHAVFTAFEVLSLIYLYLGLAVLVDE